MSCIGILLCGHLRQRVFSFLSSAFEAEPTKGISGTLRDSLAYLLWALTGHLVQRQSVIPSSRFSVVVDT